MKIYYLLMFLMYVSMSIKNYSCNGQENHNNREYTMILEYKDIQNFSLITRRSTELTEIDISGLALHSSLAVKAMETDVIGKKLIVRIVLMPAKKGLSGRFNYTIKIPPIIEEVVLGDNKYVIWRREK